MFEPTDGRVRAGRSACAGRPRRDGAGWAWPRSRMRERTRRPASSVGHRAQHGAGRRVHGFGYFPRKESSPRRGCDTEQGNLASHCARTSVHAQRATRQVRTLTPTPLPGGDGGRTCVRAQTRPLAGTKARSFAMLRMTMQRGSRTEQRNLAKPHASAMFTRNAQRATRQVRTLTPAPLPGGDGGRTCVQTHGASAHPRTLPFLQRKSGTKQRRRARSHSNTSSTGNPRKL